MRIAYYVLRVVFAGYALHCEFGRYIGLKLNGMVMQGKVCVVTGANNGFGFVASQDLVAMGATVVMVCRSEQRGGEAQARIEKATGRKPDLLLADLSLQSQVKGVVANTHCPGFVPVSRSGDGLFRKLMARLIRLMPMARSVEAAAETMVYLATDPEAATLSGLYYESGVLSRSAEQSYDVAVRRRLWQETLAFVGYEVDPLLQVVSR